MNAPASTDVSVVIPTYRREKQLQEAIDSVLAQAGVSFEVIVIDDTLQGSARASVEARDDPRVQYVPRSEPSGGRPALVRNEGARHTVGRYLYFLDDDDTLAPGTLAAMAARLDAEPAAGMAFGVIAPFGDDEQALVHERRYFEDARRRALVCHDGARLSAALVFQPGLLANSACMVRRSAFDQVGGFDAEIPICEDADFWARVAQASGHVFLDRIVVNYRTGAPSLMRGDHNTKESRRVAYSRMQSKYRRANGTLRFILMKVWARTVAR